MNKNLQNNLIFLKLIIENIILIILRKRIDIIDITKILIRKS